MTGILNKSSQISDPHNWPEVKIRVIITEQLDDYHEYQDLTSGNAVKIFVNPMASPLRTNENAGLWGNLHQTN